MMGKVPGATALKPPEARLCRGQNLTDKQHPLLLLGNSTDGQPMLLLFHLAVRVAQIVWLRIQDNQQKQ